MLPLSSFSICNGPWHPLYSTYVLDSPHMQPLSRSSLVFPLFLNPQLHAPYISSPSHRHLFATHDRTSAAYSAAIPMLCHLHLRQSYAHIIDVARICMRSSVYETVECPYVCDPSIDNSNSRQRVCWCPVSKRYRSMAAGAQQHMLSR